MARQMRLQQLKDITGNFSKEQELGRGGFGVVYKGILKNGVSVAVKRLEVNPGIQDKQFKNEINLVVLNGICKGLCYLHEECQRKPIIHLDLKPSNILLDDNLVPKIADFGLSRLFGEEQTRTCTTMVIGSIGYMAPEYYSEGEISSKSDVYSFGILILEIVTGEKNQRSRVDPSGQRYISTVWNKWSRMSKIMSQSSSLDADGCQQVDRCFKIGLNFVDLDPRRRPLASQIINMLSWECKKNEGMPSELVPKSSDGSCTSSAVTNHTVDGMCISVKIPSIAKTIELSVKKSDIVADVKLQIELKEGIHLDNQILMYAGRHLGDSQILSECGLSDDHILHVLVSPADKMCVYINIRDTRTVRVDVRNWYTVADVKLMVETMFGFPECSQILLPTKSGDAIELNGTQTLKDQNIKNNAVLMLLPDFPIFIKTWEGRTLTMVVSSFHTEEDIWEKIQKKSMINPKNTFSVTLGMF
uniref:non-specific serine/threonine protein kinase n=1 Tax=Oryza glumipatula TaxID=40148 RepID=A0A0E0BHV2_9ORYZ